MDTSISKSSKRAQKNSWQYERFEPRQLLAGVVFVDMIGNNLHVVGDHQGNAVEIDLNATQSSNLVQGQNGTTVRFSNDFDAGVDLSRMRDLRIFSNSGDDTITIKGDSSFIRDDLIVSLGYGNDSLYVVGNEAAPFEISDDFKLYAMAGHDSLMLSDVSIGDDAFLFGGAGADAFSLNRTEVGDRFYAWGQYGHDEFLVNESSFGDDVRIEFGLGADRLEANRSQFGDRMIVNGRQGWDTMMIRDCIGDERRQSIRTIERETTQTNVRNGSQEAIDQIKADFFELADEFDKDSANWIHNGLTDLAGQHGVSLVSLDLDPESQTVTIDDPTPTVSVLWDQAIQVAVANTAPGPTIASRAYAMMHTAMYDAWSTFDATAASTLMQDTYQRPASENTEANKSVAMSYAAYRILDHLFADQSDIFAQVMQDLGLGIGANSTDPTTAPGIGNLMAEALIEYRETDGSNEENGYVDNTGYAPTNPVGDVDNIERWTPEYVPIDAEPGTEDRHQAFLTPQWGNVTPFALQSGSEFRPEAPQPFLLVDGSVDLDAKTITLANDSVLEIEKDLIGTVINPEFIAQAEAVVQYSADLTDQQKLIAEFWEDGGGTSFPPGTFMTFGQFVSARDNHSVDQDAKMFFALGNAVFDAGIATWEAKVHYDYARPVRVIRELGELGLIGQYNNELGGYAIDAWTPEAGTQTILATEFLTYQTPGSDPSPPFAEYTSGHSAFSAAGATILQLFTGSDNFEASVTFESGESRFEPGETPVSSVILAWDTFSAAADEAGLSRLYGGIHFEEGDVNGRALGTDVGHAVWEKASYYINGGTT